MYKISHILKLIYTGYVQLWLMLVSKPLVSPNTLYPRTTTSNRSNTNLKRYSILKLYMCASQSFAAACPKKVPVISTSLTINIQFIKKKKKKNQQSSFSILVLISRTIVKRVYGSSKSVTNFRP